MSAGPVEVIVQSELDATVSAATDRYLMRAVRKRVRSPNGVLRIYSLAGRHLALGRYHLAPDPLPASEIQLSRRLTGGRVLPFGDGFIGVSLILPHRSAWFGTNPFTLNPTQVINRYVRGIMEACRITGLAVYYLGRDFVTVDQRVIAAVSFETDEHGVMLFEGILAKAADFSVLPDYLEAVDRQGVVKSEILQSEQMTSLEKEVGTKLSIEEVAALLQQGYAKQFGLPLERATISPLEERAIAALATGEMQRGQWLGWRRLRPDLEHQALMWAQLGAFEVHFSVEQGRFLKNVAFCGDFIADSPGVEALEHALRLCPIEWEAIHTVVNRVYADPSHYLLGVGKLRVIADMIMRSARVRRGPGPVSFSK